MGIISQEKHFHGWSMFASRNYYLYVPIFLYPIDDADEAGGIKIYILEIIKKIY